MATMTLTGEIGELDGTASADILLTIRSNTVVVDGTGAVVFDDAVTVTAVAGVFTVDLPAPGAGMLPDAWGYVVTRLVGYPRRWEVPAAAGTFDLSEFTDTTGLPVPSPPVSPVELAAETAARVAADADLQAQVDAVESAERAVSTDGSFGLPAPTGVGLEFVIDGDVLEDIRFDGASL